MTRQSYGVGGLTFRPIHVISDPMTDTIKTPTASTKPKLEKPRKYKVVLLNDDFTSVDFVIKVLIELFNKSASEAEQIMLDIHNNGKGIAGTYSREVAETKISYVAQAARHYQFPFRAILEPE